MIRIIKSRAIKRPINIVSYGEVNTAIGYGPQIANALFASGGIMIATIVDSEAILIAEEFIGDHTTAKELLAFALMVELIERPSEDDDVKIDDLLDLIAFGKITTLIRKLLASSFNNKAFVEHKTLAINVLRDMTRREVRKSKYADFIARARLVSESN